MGDSDGSGMMTAAVALLRAVNLGGHNRIGMEALRALHESLGLRDVQTYVQSGNVVFTAPGRDIGPLPKRIEAAIEPAFGFRCAVILRTAAELRDVVRRNPFAGRTDVESSRLIVVFLSREPDSEARTKALAIKLGPEETKIEGREVFVFYPNGVGRSKLTVAVMEKALGVVGTGRNWNTVTKLLEMVERRAGTGRE